MRARAHIETNKKGRNSIVITEVPYQTNKAALVEKIADLVRDKKVVGISDLRDESDKDGIRVVVETKRDAVSGGDTKPTLQKHTQLQDTFGIILLALVDGIPKIMPLKTVLNHFIDFRHEVVVRRTEFELKEAEGRAHILEGLKIALDNIDEVIKVIRGSKDPAQAKEGLMNSFNLSEAQSQAILDMRLQKLTGLEVDKVVAEYKELIQIISNLKSVLENKTKRMNIIKTELLEIKDQYGDERRTEIIPVDTDFSMEDMIAEEEVVLTITHQGYIKRTALNTYRTQRRGGRGVQGAMSKDEDFVEHLFIANTHNYMLFFTDTGKCYWLKVYDIPQAGRASRGRAIVNLIGCNPKKELRPLLVLRNLMMTTILLWQQEMALLKNSIVSIWEAKKRWNICY